MSGPSITNNSLLIKSGLMAHTWHACDELRSDQSSSALGLDDVSASLALHVPHGVCALVSAAA